MGGQIFVGRITENDGTVFPWRVRWCYPEQPWRFEEFDRTDEVEGELISLRPADKGLVCWTPDRAVALIPIGGGAYAAQRLPWPGAVNPAATCTFNGSVAWVAPAGVFLSGENISNPPTDGGSLGLIVKTIDPTTAWMLFFPRANVLLFGVDKTTTFLYDVARKEWWRVDWGGTCATLVPSLDRYRTAPDSLVVATSNGATVYGMNGFKAAGNPLLPKFKIGPFDFGLDYRKRFRHVELHIDAGNDLDLHIKHEIDGGERAGEDVERLSTPQAKLDVDFVVGVSVMGALTRVRVKSPIGDTGTYLTLTVTETTGGSVLNVQAIDLYFQAAEFVDSQGG